jgi:lysophospholipase L1-like esterase
VLRPNKNQGRAEDLTVTVRAPPLSLIIRRCSIVLFALAAFAGCAASDAAGPHEPGGVGGQDARGSGGRGTGAGGATGGSNGLDARETAAPAPVDSGSDEAPIPLPTDAGSDALVDAGIGAEALAPTDATAPADAGDAGDAGGPAAYTPCPPKGMPCVLLALGDSLTQGAGSSGGGYRPELFRQAVVHGKSFATVGSRANGPAEVAGMPFPRRHEGHGGFSIAAISTWITDNATITTYKPDIVLVHLGWNGLSPATANVAGQLENLGKLIDQIVAADSHLLVVVAQVIPMKEDVGTRNVMAFNAGIPALVKARQAAGKHVIVADIYGPFAANPNYKTEYYPSTGGHPNDAGYAAMGKAWYPALGPLLR